MSATLALTLTVAPVTPTGKVYSRHRLTVHTPSAPCMQTFEAVPGKPVHVTLACPSDLTTVVVRWFASFTEEDDGLLAQEMVAATGFALLSSVVEQSEHEVKLYDIESNAPGTLHVVASDRLHDWPHRGGNAAARQYIHRVREAYGKVQRIPGDRFDSIPVLLGGPPIELPTLWFALLATRPRMVDAANATCLFDHWLALSERLAWRDTAKDDHQMLADMLAMPSLAWVYRGDKAAGDGHPIDYWAHLMSQPVCPPEHTLVSFDCEDGTCALWEVLDVFQSLELVEASPRLLRLQQLARRYTPWMAIGELRTASGSMVVGVGGTSYQQHAYLVMLAEGEPTLTLESTAYASGVWRGQPSGPDEAPYERLQARADGTNASVRYPISLVRERRMYGRLVALLSCTPERSRHVLLGGVDTHTFLAKPRMPEPVIDVPTSELRNALRTELSLMPCSVFPRAPLACTLPKGPGLVFPSANGNVCIADGLSIQCD